MGDESADSKLREIEDAWRKFDEAREEVNRLDVAYADVCLKYANRSERTAQSDTLALRTSIDVAGSKLGNAGRTRDVVEIRLLAVLDRIFGSAE